MGISNVQGSSVWWIGRGIVDRAIGCVLTFIKARRVNEMCVGVPTKDAVRFALGVDIQSFCILGSEYIGIAKVPPRIGRGERGSNRLRRGIPWYRSPRPKGHLEGKLASSLGKWGRDTVEAVST